MVPGATVTEAVTKANQVLNISGDRGAQITVNPSALTPNTEEITVTVDIPLGKNGWITPRFTGPRTSTLKAERTGN